MPKKEDQRAERRAKKKLRQGKSPKTAAGEFVHEEIRHYKQGKHGQSKRQAIATGISKARRHGVPYPRPGRKSQRDDRETAGKSKSALYEQAKRMDIRGRSKMSKDQLSRAIKRAS